MESVEGAGQIVAQIVDVFEADVQADDAMTVVGTSGSGVKIIGNGEAGYAGPTVSDFEEFEGVYEFLDLRLGETRLKDDGENAG